MKLLLAALFAVLSIPAYAGGGGIIFGGGSGSGGGGGAGTVTAVTGTNPIISSGGTTPAISLSNTLPSSYTITGAGGLGVTYGVTAGSFTVNNVGNGTTGGVFVTSGTVSIVGAGPAIPFIMQSGAGVSSVTFDSNGNAMFIGSDTVKSMNLKNVQSGNQCLHADASGNVTGTGSDCSAGGGQSSTFASSVTVNQNFGVGSPAYGIMVGANGPSITTATPCGQIFFISSNTVSGSTTTQTTVDTIFSTYTVAGGVLQNPGDTLRVECAFSNLVTVGAPSENVESTFGTQNKIIASAFTTTANVWTRVISVLTLAQSKSVYEFIEGWTVAGNSGGGSAGGLATNNGGTNVDYSWDTTQSQLFNCSANRTSGGNINFLWMKVSKACQ